MTVCHVRNEVSGRNYTLQKNLTIDKTELVTLIQLKKRMENKETFHDLLRSLFTNNRLTYVFI